MTLRHSISVILLCVVLPLTLFSASKRLTRSHGNSWMQWKSEDIIPGVVMVKFQRGVAIAGGSTLTSSGDLSQLLTHAGVTSLVQTFPSIQPATDQEIVEGREDISRIY